MTERHFLSIDVEEWWSVHSLRGALRKSGRVPHDDRLMVGIERVLSALKDFKCTATFFVLGRVARRYPQVIEKIAADGHQLGTHGYGHELIYDLTPRTFEKDLVRSLEALSDIVKRPITVYRAPSYSITPNTLWALEILAANGIEIDSSIMPTANRRFGIKGAPGLPYRIHWHDRTESLIEAPPSTIKIGSLIFPFASGFFFRSLPTTVVEYGLRQVQKNGGNATFVLHSWEFDPFHPRLKKTGLINGLIHYYHLRDTELKIRYLLGKYSFTDLSNMKTNQIEQKMFIGKRCMQHSPILQQPADTKGA